MTPGHGFAHAVDNFSFFFLLIDLNQTFTLHPMPTKKNIEIESAVPAPPVVQQGRPAVYPFAEMKKGDSFIYRKKNTLGLLKAARALAFHHTQRHFKAERLEGRKEFAAAVDQENHIRIWRTV